MNPSELHSLSLMSMLEEHARSYPRKIAVAGDEGQRHTWPEFRDRVGRLAAALQSAGVSHGDRVLWLGQNSFRILEGILACARLGAIFCPANWRQSAAELAFVVDDFDPRIVFWQSEEIGSAVEEARKLALGSQARWIHVEQAYESFLETGSLPDSPMPRVEEACVALYTAAFDGYPNAALLSQRALLAQSSVVATISGYTDRTVFLSSGPLFHIGTLKFMLAAFYCGGTNVFIRRTDPEAICRVVHEERCTVAFLVTKTVQEMAAINRDRRYDLSCLTSESISPEWDAMVQVVPRQLDRAGGYGQTEVCGLALWVYYGGRGMGSHGRPSPVAQVRLLDDAGTPVPQGEVGEFAIRGPIVMNGYWNRPELNAQRQAGGWHRCNDLGRHETDGSYTFIGPKTQMIKSGVENVYPAEVEACLKSHPSVADCGVIGVPDATWIQNVKAVVALKPGTTATEAELVEHCRARIASYKKPRSVVFVERIPRLPTFAVDYRALDAAHGGGGYPGGETRSK